MFADIHSHILPGVDDGPKESQHSRQLLSELSACGVTHLAFTPHYYPDQRTIHSFLDKREKAYREILGFPEADKFSFALGAEVYLTGTLFIKENLTRLCFQGTSLMLTELEYTDQFADVTRLRLLRLTEERGITPILAHIDRYPFLWKNTKLLHKLRDMGCLFQVNLSAFADPFSRARALRVMDEGLVDFLGEDVHSFTMPSKKKEKIFDFLEKKRPGFLTSVAKKAEINLFSNQK